MKSREFPIYRSIHQIMLYWVVMDIVKMSGKIFIIPNGMFPKSVLPNFSIISFVSKPMSEATFDYAPPFRVVEVALRQPPYTVKVIRQNYHCLFIK